MDVFLTDGDQRMTLAVARALGRYGIRVTVGEEVPTSLAGKSRYCTKAVRYPSPLREGREFQGFIRQEMESGKYQVLLPMTDVTVRLIAQVRDTFPPSVRLPIPDEEKIQRAQDKRDMVLLAQELGIGFPETFGLQEKESLSDIAQRLRYPVVIKPRFSRHLQNGHWSTGPVRYAYDSQDLMAKYKEAHERVPFPLIQEKVEGEGRGVFLLLWDGKLKAAFCHRRLREKPPWGGVSVYRESIPLDQDIVQKSFSLLKAIGWQGVAMVEYKVDRRSGALKLMEVNGRFWGSLQLAIDAGMNFPVILYRLATGENVPDQFDYKVGVRSRWLLGDLDQLLIQLKHSRWANGSSPRSSSRVRACLDFLKLYKRDTFYEIFRFDDPAPGWFECQTYLRAAVQRLLRRKDNVNAG